ncbi:MAG: FAD-dependent oxidoreductase [Alphaproteobacteria bacterium]|nr:FAD-dependent oxidoreductase [Alphaproteobacteria bacterium]|tara:strand:- start:1268 stop:2389 length:1122 start_codon:yes stop_codon:yes gene_type:complete
MDKLSVDVLVIGGGIAGASVAANLTSKTKVVVVEAEEHPGFHSTGRSVAVYAPMYGSKVIRDITAMSSPLFKKAEDELSQAILSQRGFLFIAKKHQHQAMNNLRKELSKLSNLTHMNIEEAQKLVPAIKSQYVSEALFDPDAKDIDVSTLHHYYINQLRACGGKILLSQRVKKIEQIGSHYEVVCDTVTIFCNKIVNAAGAWADEIGQLAGCKKLGLKPLRRTAFSFEPDNWDYKDWPVVIDCEEEFYIKPETGSIIGSPADETEDIPRDVYAEEIDIAIGMDRITAALDFKVKSIQSSWAGLRTFTPDRDPVVGFDKKHKNFFWLAGQGGYGIQTAPYLGKLSSDLILGNTYSQTTEDSELITALSPNRFNK